MLCTCRDDLQNHALTLNENENCQGNNYQPVLKWGGSTKLYAMVRSASIIQPQTV